jgi:hypothetical protein
MLDLQLINFEIYVALAGFRVESPVEGLTGRKGSGKRREAGKE